MKKKLIILSLCTVVILSICGCGKETENDQSQAEVVDTSESLDQDDIDTDKSEYNDIDTDESEYDGIDNENSDEELDDVADTIQKAEEIAGEITGSGVLRKVDPDKVTDVFTVPDGVEAIGSNAFTGVPVKEVIIPDSVKIIWPYAFVDCTTLEKVDVPESVTNVGDSAFLGCSSLKSLIIRRENCALGDGIVNGCKSLEHCEIPYADKLHRHTYEHNDSNGNDIDTSDWENNICIYCGFIEKK